MGGKGFIWASGKWPQGEARLNTATRCQGSAVPGKPYMEDAASSKGRGAGPRRATEEPGLWMWHGENADGSF